MKRRILFSIAIIILIAPLVYVAASLINFGYNYINFLDMPGPCNSRVRGITRDSNHSVEYQWMPDGSAIVIMNKIGSAQLGTRFDFVNIDEGTVENLITYPVSYSEPSVDDFMLSPSGQYIAIPEIKYLNSDFYPNLAIYETDDREQTPESHLMMKIDDAYAGLWSPDENHIALAAVPNPSPPHQQYIRLAPFPPTITQVITLTTSEYNVWNPLVGWSANERFIVVNMGRPNALRLIDIDSGEVAILNQEKTCYSNMTLSPAEDKLALASHEEYAIDEGESGWDITIQDLTEGKTKIVTDFIDEDEIQPTWSPDGQRLAFLRAFIDDTGEAQQEIMIMDLASNSMTNLTNAAELNPFFPQWSPRGDKIAFLTYDDDSGYHLNVIDVEGKDLVVLYSAEDY